MAQPEAANTRRPKIDIRKGDVFIKRILARQASLEVKQTNRSADLGYPVFYGPDGNG